MAQYKDTTNVTYSSSDDFDKKHSPGVTAPYPGIYRCVGCGDEIGIAKGHTLPSQNDVQHPPNKGKIEWKLLVRGQQKS